MNKPFTSEIIKAMADHSDLSAAYASAMMWDYKRRLTIEEVKKVIHDLLCAFCIRYLNKGKQEECPLYKIFGNCCHHDDNVNVWRKMSNALEARDQQAFTTDANDLYFLIRSIIDDLYKEQCKPKPEPKKEVFYKKGQILKRANGELWTLTQTVYGDDDADEDNAGRGVTMVGLVRKGETFAGSKIIESHKGNVTEAELENICGNTFGTFTLIEDKK